MGFLTPAVPGPVASVARAIDPIQRETKGNFWEVLQERIPGLRSMLPPKVDIYGQPKPYTEGPISSLLGARITPVESDPAAAELARLGMTLAPTSQTLKGTTLSTPDYIRLQQAIGTLMQPQLNALVQSQDFQQADDETKREMLTNLINAVRKQGRLQYTLQE
jgi:hypothetical protein